MAHGDFHEMFDVKEAPAPVPEEARIFKTVTCSVCGERFAESFARLQDGEIVCSACYRPYTRGLGWNIRLMICTPGSKARS